MSRIGLASQFMANSEFEVGRSMFPWMQHADKRRTSNIEHRTPNLEPRTGPSGAGAGLDRRAFLRSTTLAAGVAALDLNTSAAERTPPASSGLIDVNVNLSHWPVRRMPGEEIPALLGELHAQGVSQVWAGSFDGLLHKDIATVNTRLAAACRLQERGSLVPFGSINPLLPDWEDDLRRCAEVHRMPGIRLHPNYHGYKLNDPAFVRLLRLATDRRLIVQLALLMEDERMMHPLLRVPPVDPAPLVEVVQETPGLRLVLLNALQVLRGESLRRFTQAGGVYVEISTLEGVGGLANLLQQIPLDRVLFGSHFPLFYLASAVLKLKESLLTPAQLQAIRSENARRLMSS